MFDWTVYVVRTVLGVASKWAKKKSRLCKWHAYFLSTIHLKCTTFIILGMSVKWKTLQVFFRSFMNFQEDNLGRRSRFPRKFVPKSIIPFESEVSIFNAKWSIVSKQHIPCFCFRNQAKASLVLKSSPSFPISSLRPQPKPTGRHEGRRQRNKMGDN